MGKKSKRGSGPRLGSDRAERIAARKARQAASLLAPTRPFEGLAAECDLVAMRSFIASATAQITFAGDTKHEVDVATVLPGAAFADVLDRGDRGVLGRVALQTDPEPADLQASMSAALTWASSAAPGDEYTGDAADKTLREIIDPTAQLSVIVYEDFNWWFGDDADLDPQVKAMIDRANATILPTSRLHPDSGVGAPWWVDAGERAHLRWVRPEDETTLMNALARVHAAGGLTLGENSRFAGSFRTHGLVVPVFDLDVEAHHEEWYPGLDALDKALAEALADTSDLTAAERASRAGIIGRQVTLR